MPSRALHEWLILIELGLGAVTFLALLFLAAPYGRHARPGFGPTVPARVGWIIMESPALLAFAWFYSAGPHRLDPVPMLFFGLWLVHYTHRVIVFPLRMRPGQRSMPIVIVMSAIAFNFLNAAVNAPQLSAYGIYPTATLGEPHFWIGLTLFLGGFFANLHADSVLRELRKPGETSYAIPRGGLYEFVASPNYLAEIIEWIGFAIATWSLAGLSFALYTAANLVPRALANLKWYRSTFPDYPSHRKAVFPWVL